MMSVATATAEATPTAGSEALFEDLASSIGRIPGLLAAIPDMIREPSANPTQSLLVIAILVTLVLLILVSMVLLAMGPSRPARSSLRPRGEGEARPPARPRLLDRTGWRSPAMSRLLVASIVVILVAGLLAVVGVTSGGRTACVSCHPDSHGIAALGTDPHRAVACVACHEAGGDVARTTINAVPRFEHMVLGWLGDSGASGYGLPVASDSCRGCHGTRIAVVLTKSPRGLKMSHKEPLNAGAECVDCHQLEDGVIASATGGMAPCRRCHGTGSVFSACDRCHDGDPALAARTPDLTGTLTATALVENPRCDGCHVSQKTCDACHGIRMPHTGSFMVAGHARAAAIDIWDNGGRVCRKCHYKGHRPCSQCHAAFPSHPASFRLLHRSGDPITGCTCHEWDPKARGMTFCQLCHPVGPADSE
jgi:hypothetical protein